MILALLLFASTWDRAATPRFEVFSRVSEDEARATLSTLDAVRLRAEKITGWRSRGDEVCVVLGQNVETGYRLALGRDYILITPPLQENLPLAALEYARLWIRRSGRDLPPWAREGLAKSFAASPVGYVPDPLPLELLLAADSRNVPSYESRVFVEYLRATLKERFPTLLESLVLHQAPEQALEWITGKTMAQMEEATRQFTVTPEPLDVVMPKADWGAAPPVEADLVEIALGHGQAGDLTKRYPQEPAAWAALGEEERASRHEDAARAAYAKAWELGTQDEEVLWQYALLLDPGGPRNAVLEKLLGVNPAHWEARIELAQAAITDKAYDKARRYLAPLPEPSAPEAPAYYRTQSHAARLAMNRAEALASAARMTAIARTDLLRREADDLTRMAKDMPEPNPNKAEQGITMSDKHLSDLGARRGETKPLPETYGPKVIEGKAMPSFDGLLKSVDCEGQQAVLHIEIDGRMREFKIFDSKQVVVKSAHGGEAEIPCGVLPTALHVRGEYEEREEFPLLRFLEFL